MSGEPQGAVELLADDRKVLASAAMRLDFTSDKVVGRVVGPLSVTKRGKATWLRWWWSGLPHGFRTIRLDEPVKVRPADNLALTFDIRIDWTEAEGD